LNKDKRRLKEKIKKEEKVKSENSWGIVVMEEG